MFPRERKEFLVCALFGDSCSVNQNRKNDISTKNRVFPADPPQTPCLQGIFQFSLWKNLWKVWKTQREKFYKKPQFFAVM